MKKKLFVIPATESLYFTAQSIICSSPEGYHQGGGGSYGDGDTNDNGDF